MSDARPNADDTTPGEATTGREPFARSGATDPADPRPHRAPTILALGLLAFTGIVAAAFVESLLLWCLGLLGPIAWILGRRDLGAIERREMNRSGRPMTRTGTTLGAIASAILVWQLLMLTIRSLSGAVS